jgi:hypothetical protein
LPLPRRPRHTEITFFSFFYPLNKKLKTHCDSHTMSTPAPPPAPSPSPAPLIWFSLLDSTTGEPFKGTTVSSVLRSSLVVSVVDQFRDAVKKKDKDDGDAAVLTPFKSSQLLVFMNKAAFDKRNDDDGKEEALKSSRTVEGLGETEEDALIVAVPSTSGDSLLPFISYSLSFYLGSQSSFSLSPSLPSLLLSSIVCYLVFCSSLPLSNLPFLLFSFFSNLLFYSSLYSSL